MDWATIAWAVLASSTVSGILVFVAKRLIESGLDVRFSRLKEEALIDIRERARRSSALHDLQIDALRDLAPTNLEIRDQAISAVLNAEQGRWGTFYACCGDLTSLASRLRAAITQHSAVLPNEALDAAISLMQPTEWFAAQRVTAHERLPDGAGMTADYGRVLNSTLSRLEDASSKLETFTRSFVGSEPP